MSRVGEAPPPASARWEPSEKHRTPSESEASAMTDREAVAATLLGLFELAFGLVAGWLGGVFSGLIQFSC